MQPIDILDTPRLVLRPYTTQDHEPLHKILSDAETMRFWPAPFTLEQTSAWIERSIKSYKQNGFGRYAVILKADRCLIGDCGILRTETDGCFENDLGYIIHSKHWSRGYAAEAARALKAFAFEKLKLTRLCANMPESHAASIRVAEKIGMTKEKEFFNPKNRNRLTYLYSVTKK